MGDLLALSVKTGEVAWRKSFEQDYGTGVPAWGMTGAPIVVDDLLIAVVGGGDGAFVVGFSKTTGEEVWRALSSEHGQGYSAPLLIERGGVRQLIVWHPVAVSSLDPATGRGCGSNLSRRVSAWRPRCSTESICSSPLSSTAR
jgi:outer membrane protein assembly factor BamB